MYALLLLALAQPPAAHDANTLYKQLLDPGLAVGGGHRAKLPPPSMPDGLDAAKQKAVIQGVIGGDYTLDDFARKSVVAPQVLRLRDITPSDAAAPAKGVDLWFVAYGDFARLDDEKFLERLSNAGRGEGKGRELTTVDLTKRKITVGDEKKEKFGVVEFDFLEKVRLKATGRTMWSKGAESAVVAGEIDPRFRTDGEFPNQWQSIIKDGGATKYGPASAWGGAAFYLKITKLAEPAGALFVEQHIVFAEPTGWFDGANLLRSKLPPVVQNNVRSMRREWAKP